jgi:putative hemolysin
MELITAEQLGKVIGTENFPGKKINKLLMWLLKLNDINDVYRDTYFLQREDFIDGVLEELGIKYFVAEEDLKKIPTDSPFITVSNHPFGIVDGLILLKIMLARRSDYKIMANFFLEQVEPLKELIFSLNPFEGESKKRSNYSGLKQGKKHLADGYCMGVFPSGEVSGFSIKNGVIDKPWKNSIVKLVKNAEVPVVPIYFHGSNSILFHLLGLLNPKLRTVRLPSEALNKRSKEIAVRIGNPISVEEIQIFSSTDQLSQFLRSKTYSLGSVLNENASVSTVTMERLKEQVLAPLDVNILEREIKTISSDAFLFETGSYQVFCTSSRHIPHLMYEIGRLREITYREVGEGVGEQLDIDEYDSYYHQLFVWDANNKKIVGGYRIGAGEEIYNCYGKKGFYVNSLFNFSEEFNSVFPHAVELGRSFVVKEYQKKAFSLFCLWKGILHFLLKNKNYRYIIGPVSISNQYSNLSKRLMIDFIQNYYFDFHIGRYVSPKKKYKVSSVDNDLHSALSPGENDINQLDRIITEIENGKMKVPVLFKKYFEQNARIIGFNLDPKFNNALDGLMILDIHDLPLATIKNLSQGVLQKNEVMDRFYGSRPVSYVNAAQY